MAFNPKQFLADFFGALAEVDRDRVEALVHPEFESELRQSGERSNGFEQFWAQFVNYPGGGPLPDVPNIRLLGDDERWAISPAYTVVPLASSNQFTAISRVQYPDGLTWHVISILEIRDDKLYRMDSYFAPELPAPLAASIANYQHG